MKKTGDKRVNQKTIVWQEVMETQPGHSAMDQIMSPKIIY